MVQEGLGGQIRIQDGMSFLHAIDRSLANLYQSGCDVPTHLYSFSFNLNPNWSKELCDQSEILNCKSNNISQ